MAACYVLTLGHPETMETNRQAGAYLGLRPCQQQSGDCNPQCGITKTGNSYLRSLLVQSAQYILGRFGPDSELRCWGLKLAACGGKRGKKRAIVAVARKLAVLLLSMWPTARSLNLSSVGDPVSLRPSNPFPLTRSTRNRTEFVADESISSLGDCAQRLGLPRPRFR